MAGRVQLHALIVFPLPLEICGCDSLGTALQLSNDLHSQKGGGVVVVSILPNPLFSEAGSMSIIISSVFLLIYVWHVLANAEYF